MTIPRVDEAGLAAYYPDSYQPHNEQVAGDGLVTKLRQKLLRILRGRELRRMPYSELPSSPGELLEVGCGRGELGGALIERGWRVRGIEPAASACALAAEKGLDVQQGTLSSVELDGVVVDAVIFQHSLEHVFDPAVDMERVVRLLSPGGRVLISVPNYGSPQRRLFGGYWFNLDVPRHRYHYTAKSLEALVQRAGLDVVRVSASNSVVGLLGSVSYRIFGNWRFGGSAWGMRFFMVTGIALLPVSWLISRNNGDVLHVVAEKPRRTVQT
jgi:SAM-dependent methyltransferase